MKKTLIFSIMGLLSVCLIAVACNSENAAANSTAENTKNAPSKTKQAQTQAKTHPAAATSNSGKKSAKDYDHMNVGGMKWLTMEEAGKIKNNDGKKFLVDVYTDWCGWCKVMDKNTFTDPGLKTYLEENYHLVKFNAEQKDPINFKGQTYEWMPAGRKGVNKLALEILGGRLSYPTLVYFDENLQKIKTSPGYKKPDQLMNELKVLDNS